MVLVTGGAGYIGSHACVELIESGYEVVIFDNFCNSSRESIRRVEKIVNQSIEVMEGDIRNSEDIQVVFDKYNIDAVIHFAGLKSVSESVSNPLKYYDTNVIGTMILCQVMKKNNCKRIIFSSSATVYGKPITPCIKEDFFLYPESPYGKSKLVAEQILNDLYSSDNEWKIVALRYFNPVGAHTSGQIGEDPNDIPNNLMPFIAQIAVGKREYLNVFGDDYDTYDGTGVRDYIHVVDLAQGHVKALKAIDILDNVLTVNLGTGVGYSVLDMIKAFEKASSKKIPYVIAPRRAGDIDKYFANSEYAKEVLDWEATKDIDEMCTDTWRWQSNNPNGYNS